MEFHPHRIAVPIGNPIRMIIGMCANYTLLPVL